MTAKPDGLPATLLAHARRHPGIEEGVACAGTKLESRTVKVRGKAFAFFASDKLRLKLGSSLAEAQAFAARSPDACSAGAGGWIAVRFAVCAPPTALLRRWLDESHALFAGAAPKAAPKAAKGKTSAPARKRRR
jgi:hypothetical protein